MTNEKALAIANEFLQDMNPTMWNGEGPQPQLDQRIWEDADTFPDLAIDISIEDNGVEGWCTFIELVDKATNTMIECSSCYGIDSPQNIADVIMELCGWNGVN